MFVIRVYARGTRPLRPLVSSHTRYGRGYTTRTQRAAARPCLQGGCIDRRRHGGHTGLSTWVIIVNPDKGLLSTAERAHPRLGNHLRHRPIPATLTPVWERVNHGGSPGHPPQWAGVPRAPASYAPDVRGPKWLARGEGGRALRRATPQRQQGVLRAPSPLPTVRAISHIAHMGHALSLSCSWQQ